MKELNLSNILIKVTSLLSKINYNTELLLEIETIIKTAHFIGASLNESEQKDFINKLKTLEFSLNDSSEILKRVQEELSEASKITSDS